ncbi:MAG TPA: hypothetical protein VNW25_03995 [Candidatus Sulfotelmatobacter sp.]|nr:hypothetical protein [Candidatus Sulfotelmatobacter sp.]
MGEHPPYPPPPGARWVRQYWLFGPWILVPDEQYPLPPPGYRYRPNPLTAKPELYSVVGGGIDWFSDGNEVKKPNYGSLNRVYLTPAAIPPEKIGKGVDFFEPNEDKAALAEKAKERQRRQQLADQYVQSA